MIGAARRRAVICRPPVGIGLGLLMCATWLAGCGPAETGGEDTSGGVAWVWQQKQGELAGPVFSFDAKQNLVQMKMVLTEADVSGLVEVFGIKDSSFHQVETVLVAGQTTKIGEISGTRTSGPETFELDYELVGGTLNVDDQGSITFAYDLRVSLSGVVLSICTSFTEKGSLGAQRNTIQYSTVSLHGIITVDADQQEFSQGPQPVTFRWELVKGNPLPQ